MAKALFTYKELWAPNSLNNSTNDFATLVYIWIHLNNLNTQTENGEINFEKFFEQNGK